MTWAAETVKTAINNVNNPKFLLKVYIKSNASLKLIRILLTEL